MEEGRGDFHLESEQISLPFHRCGVNGRFLQKDAHPRRNYNRSNGQTTSLSLALHVRQRPLSPILVHVGALAERAAAFAAKSRHVLGGWKKKMHVLAAMSKLSPQG